MLLAGDVGGTKTVLAIYEERGATDFDHEPLVEATFPSAQYESLEAIIAQFLAGGDYSLSGASFGVAGPVVDQRVEVTNLPWTIDARVITDTFGVNTHLLNDLEAIANAVPYLEAADLYTLNPGRPQPTGAKAVIAPGTGLGEAFLVWQGERYESYPSEGGHAAFAPTTARQIDMLTYWLERMDHVSYERLCSGIGIPNIYRYLHDSGAYPEPAWLAAEFDAATDSTPVIVSAAVTEKAPLCIATLDLFMEIFGGESANLALKVLATGGVYVGGGIPAAHLAAAGAQQFLARFPQQRTFWQVDGDHSRPRHPQPQSCALRRGL